MGENNNWSVERVACGSVGVVFVSANAIVSKRFGLMQNGKLRPIDDYSPKFPMNMSGPKDRTKKQKTVQPMMMRR